MKSAPFRIGLIGSGITGQLRARAVRQIAHARLVALAGADPKEAEAIHREHPGLRILADGESLAREDEIDGAVITTAAATHQPLALACLRAGKHVLCEKPLAVTIEACQRLIDAARVAQRCLATGFFLRHSPAARLARQLVDSGTIGRVNHVRVFHGHSGTEYFGPNWKVDVKQTGGGCLMDGGNHLIDMLRWFLGDVSEIVGFATESVWRQRGCEDNGFLLMRTADGRVGQVHASWSEWRGYRYSVDVYGTDGYVRFGYSPLWLVHATGKRGERMKVRRHIFPAFQVIERLRGWQWSVAKMQEADLRDWIEAAASGSEAPASGRDGLEAVRAAQTVARECPRS
jgi:predicted dehydrogenase